MKKYILMFVMSVCVAQTYRIGAHDFEQDQQNIAQSYQALHDQYCEQADATDPDIQLICAYIQTMAQQGVELQAAKDYFVELFKFLAVQTVFEPEWLEDPATWQEHKHTLAQLIRDDAF